MSAEKESSKPEKSDPRPTEKKTDELDEKQLDKAGGGSGWPYTTTRNSPVTPTI
jgi:hypothetical protein